MTIRPGVRPGGAVDVNDPALRAAFDAWADEGGIGGGLSGMLTGSAATASADQLAAIHAALATYDQVILFGGTFRIDDRIVMGSGKRLVLWNAEVVRHPDGKPAGSTNSNIVVNAFAAAGSGSRDSDIHIVGIGRAAMRVNDATAHPRSSVSLRANFGLGFLNAERIRVRNIKLGPTQSFAGNLQVCSDVIFENIDLAQDVATPNQDGLDIGPGCFDIVFRGITGKTGDDAFSFYAQNTSGSLWPYTKTLTAAERNTARITVSDVVVDAGINMFRLQAGDGSTLTDIVINDVTNTHVGASTSGSPICFLQFGPTGYVTTLPANTDLARIKATGVKGSFAYLLGLDSKGSHVHVSDVEITNTFTRIVGMVGANNQGGFTPDWTDIVVDGVSHSSPATSGGGVVMAVTSGTVARCSLRNMSFRRLQGFLANGATVTSLDMSNIRTAVMSTSVPFRSTVAETGRVSDVTWDVKTAGLQHYAGAASGLLFSGDVPEVFAGDVVPLPVRGSMIRAKAGLDPTGGSFAQSALYYGDGTAWNRIATLTA